jgi:hypothetical protein
MAYDLFKERDAAGEIRWLKETYGQAFSEAFDVYAQYLCVQAAQSNEFKDAVDLDKVLDDLSEGKIPSDLKRSWEEMKKAGWLDKAKALLSLIRNVRPPWRARVVEWHGLPGLGGQITIAIRVYFTIDDVKKRIVIRAVDQLES